MKKKKKKLHKYCKLAQHMLYFSSIKRWAQITLQTIQCTEKKHKNAQKKITQKFTIINCV